MTDSVEKVNTVLKRSLWIFKNQTPLGIDHLKKVYFFLHYISTRDSYNNLDQVFHRYYSLYR